VDQFKRGLTSKASPVGMEDDNYCIPDFAVALLLEKLKPLQF